MGLMYGIKNDEEFYNLIDNDPWQKGWWSGFLNTPTPCPYPDSAAADARKQFWQEGQDAGEKYRMTMEKK